MKSSACKPVYGQPLTVQYRHVHHDHRDVGAEHRALAQSFRRALLLLSGTWLPRPLAAASITAATSIADNLSCSEIPAHAESEDTR